MGFGEGVCAQVAFAPSAESGVDQDADYKPVVSVSSSNGQEILMRPMSDGSVVVGMFNRTSAPVEMSFPLPSSLEGKKIAARDLWKHEPVTTQGESFTATVPTHGVVLVKFSAK